MDKWWSSGGEKIAKEYEAALTIIRWSLFSFPERGITYWEFIEFGV
jgi:hypothetical protein